MYYTSAIRSRDLEGAYYEIAWYRIYSRLSCYSKLFVTTSIWRINNHQSLTQLKSLTLKSWSKRRETCSDDPFASYIDKKWKALLILLYLKEIQPISMTKPCWIYMANANYIHFNTSISWSSAQFLLQHLLPGLSVMHRIGGYS
jgi:hypothetical protein